MIKTRKTSARQRVTASGRLRVTVYNTEGQIERIEEGKNLIVTSGLESLAGIIGGEPAKVIDTFGAGTSGTAPSSGDTSLTSAFTKAIDTVAYPSSGKVTFSFSIDTAEGNGATYQEWGLFSNDGTMFSRKTSSPILKTSSIRIVGDWTITFQL